MLILIGLYVQIRKVKAIINAYVVISYNLLISNKLNIHEKSIQQIVFNHRHSLALKHY